LRSIAAPGGRFRSAVAALRSLKAGLDEWARAL
jgi:hypothetical protein